MASFDNSINEFIRLSILPLNRAVAITSTTGLAAHCLFTSSKGISLFEIHNQATMTTMSRLARWWVLGRKDMDAPLVTVIRLSGILQQPAGGAPRPQARRLINYERIEKWLNRAFFKPLNPAACAVVVNSPGGSPVQAELIHDAVQTLSKQSGIPVFTFAEDVAASGGYWLLCSGKESYASATSIVGSVGVVSASFGFVEAATKVGVERRVFTSGDEKIPLDPFLPVSEEQESRLREVMGDLHETFKSVVRAARGERLRGAEARVFSGRVFSGKQAVELGLVDGLGSMRSVMTEKFGDRTRFLLCSEPQQAGLRDVLGIAGLEKAAGGESLLGRWGLRGHGANEEANYAFARAAVDAALDAAEDRSLWNRFRTE
jgi:signal peptide peptidase SppA